MHILKSNQRLYRTLHTTSPQTALHDQFGNRCVCGFGRFLDCFCTCDLCPSSPSGNYSRLETALVTEFVTVCSPETCHHIVLVVLEFADATMPHMVFPFVIYPHDSHKVLVISNFPALSTLQA